MSIQPENNRVGESLAAAVMMFMPVTIGYYLVFFGFDFWGLPVLYVFAGGIVLAMGGSALAAFAVYKLANFLIARVRNYGH
jgi:hypothetical protein